MKTTKNRLMNILITMSVAINLVMLGGLGYIALIDNHVKNIHAALNLPVMIYVPKAMASSGIATSIPAAPAQ